MIKIVIPKSFEVVAPYFKERFLLLPVLWQKVKQQRSMIF